MNVRVEEDVAIGANSFVRPVEISRSGLWLVTVDQRVQEGDDLVFFLGR
jgi:hypothetical protein